MRTFTIALAMTALLLGFLAPTVAHAQTISQVYIVSVKSGSGPEFEAAFKGYVDWRKANGDPWTWTVAQAVNGDALGQYVILSGDHQWADLDSYDDPDPTGAQFTSTVGPHTDSIVSRISQSIPEISNMPADLSEYSLYQVNTYELRDQAAFMEAIAKFHAALQEADPSLHYGFSTIVGGPLAINLVLPARNWADFAPPDKPFPQIITEAYGAEEFSALMATFAMGWRSATSTTWQVRPDLSLLQAP